MKKRILLLMAGALMLTGCSGTKTVRFGTAGEGGVYAAFGKAFAELSKGEKNGISVNVKDTAGSAANIHLLSKGYIQLGLAQSDLINEMYYAGELTGNEAESYRGYSAIAPLWSEAVQIVVAADSEINSMDDLFDKTVSVGLEDSGTERNAHQILSAIGLNQALVKYVNYSYEDSIKHVLDGTVDAMFMTAGAPNAILAAHADEIRLIGLTQKEQLHLQRMFDGYTSMIIPADTYACLSAPLQTVGVQAVLLASNELSDDTVYKLTDLLYKNAESLKEGIPVKADLRADDAAENIYIPFHTGALAWYNDNGFEVDQ